MRHQAAALAVVLLAGCPTGDDTCEGEPERVKYVDWHANTVGTGADLHAIQLFGGSGWVVGDGVAAWTDDGGETWTPGSFAGDTTISDIARGDTATGLVVGDGGLILSVNSDNRFEVTTVATDFTNDLFAIDLVGNDGAIAGDGVLLRTTNAGASFESAPMDGTFRAVTVSGPAPWAVGDAGAAATWDGTQWSPVDVGSSADLDAVVFMDADHGVIAGSGEVWVTDDGGDSWRAATTPPDEALTSAIGGFALLATGAAGTVYRSEDFGDSWLPIFASGVAGIGGISTFEDDTMPNTQIVVAAPGDQVLVYGSRFEQEVVDPGWAGCP
jgi:hypothetical protein